MTPSQAEVQGYERISKYPKSTKYGRQNPISERWNSEDQLALWRAAWANVTNRFLERARLIGARSVLIIVAMRSVGRMNSLPFMRE